MGKKKQEDKKQEEKFKTVVNIYGPDTVTVGTYDEKKAQWAIKQMRIVDFQELLKRDKNFVFTESLRVEKRDRDKLEKQLPSQDESTSALRASYITDIFPTEVSNSLSQYVMFAQTAVGWGVFAKKTIPKDTLVCVYSGQLRNPTSLNKKDDYQYTVAIGDLEQENKIICVVDAAAMGGTGSVINCFPKKNSFEVESRFFVTPPCYANVSITSERLTDGTCIPVIQTTTEIPAGTQLGFDYSFYFGKTKKEMKFFGPDSRSILQRGKDYFDLADILVDFTKNEKGEFVLNTDKSIVISKDIFSNILKAWQPVDLEELLETLKKKHAENKTAQENIEFVSQDEAKVKKDLLKRLGECCKKYYSAQETIQTNLSSSREFTRKKLHGFLKDLSEAYMEAKKEILEVHRDMSRKNMDLGEEFEKELEEHEALYKILQDIIVTKLSYFLKTSDTDTMLALQKFGLLTQPNRDKISNPITLCTEGKYQDAINVWGGDIFSALKELNVYGTDQEDNKEWQTANKIYVWAQDRLQQETKSKDTSEYQELAKYYQDALVRVAENVIQETAAILTH